MHKLKKNIGIVSAALMTVLCSLCKEAGRVLRTRQKALWVLNRRCCPYPRNGGKPHSRMYVITPAAQMSTLRPYLRKEVGQNYIRPGHIKGPGQIGDSPILNPKPTQTK